ATAGRGGERSALPWELDIEDRDARANCLLELGRSLADAREHDCVGGEPRRECPAQRAHRADVRSRPESLEYFEDADIAVRLDGIADTMRHVFQGVVQGVVLRPDQVGAIHVCWRTDALRDAAQQRRVEA